MIARFDNEGWINREPCVCKKFGCGKVLTINERRLSGRCINHQSKEEGITESFMKEYFEKLDELIKPEIAA